MRLTQTRILSQVFFFALFLFFAIVADLRYLKGYPVSLFLELDPLVGLATVMSTHELYKGLLWGVVTIIVTLLLGRVFCGWVCPYGSLHHFVGWALGRRSKKWRIDANRYRPVFQLKYVILIIFLVAAAMGSLQVGLLDPIALFTRTMTAALLPGIDRVWPGTIHVGEAAFGGGILIGAILLVLVGLNLIIPRFFCRVLCPLGALLGVLARFSVWRIDREAKTCNSCNACLIGCEGAADPHDKLRKSECIVCFNCLDDCAQGSLRFGALPPRATEIAGPQLQGRRTALSVLAGVFVYPLMRVSGATGKNFNSKAIRPPGATPEPEFLARCIKCDQCLRVCPTNVLQPAALETGVEGIWTPVLNMRTGYCELNCTLCGQVCPTGAIQSITIEEKIGRGEHAAQGPIRLGTAFFDRGRCLPWAMDKACVVCEEVCPTSPKAIFSRNETIVRRDGTPVTLKRPFMDPALCIGCGICEHECPVAGCAAVRVSAVGETRSPERRLLLS